jgi:hypothetical protein
LDFIVATINKNQIWYTTKPLYFVHTLNTSSKVKIGELGIYELKTGLDVMITDPSKLFQLFTSYGQIAKQGAVTLFDGPLEQYI